eukprot:scaffold81991_cov72-Phaeocystis_antarctica.AAC.5
MSKYRMLRLHTLETGSVQYARRARRGDDRGSPTPSENGEKDTQLRASTRPGRAVTHPPVSSFSVSSLAAEHLGNKAVKGVLRWHLNCI